MSTNKYQNLLEFTLVFVIGIMVTKMAANEFIVITQPVSAQVSNSINMTSLMVDSVSFHLKTADELLMNGDTAAALDQINLAELQLSLLNMGP